MSAGSAATQAGLPEGARARVVDRVVERIVRRKASVFQLAGEARCRVYAEAGFDAMVRDVAEDKSAGCRELVSMLMDQLAGEGLSFSDLRYYASRLRAELREILIEAEAEAELRVAVEAWFCELVTVSSMRFMAWRDEQRAKQAAQRGVEHLESQLEELAEALEEQTRLLDVIRQASTPIVPVVRGILVVPLIGTFDSERAELLTEQLLHAIARLKARSAILDISGVPLFDTAAAQLVIRLTRTVRMLGTQIVLVGMSPVNARTIVGLGVDLGDVETRATLQDGLARAMLAQGMEICALRQGVSSGSAGSVPATNSSPSR